MDWFRASYKYKNALTLHFFFNKRYLSGADKSVDVLS